MAQDFARHRDRPANRDGRPRAATRATPPPPSHWNWYIAGVLSGFFAVFIGYVGIANLGSDAQGDAATQQVVVAEEDLPIFSFYNELANASVDVGNTLAPGLTATPPPVAVADPDTEAAAPSAATDQPADATTPATAPAATATEVATSTSSSADSREYLLQAGSFQDRQDAENRRAKIILLNMNASVVPGLVAGRTWQRVQVGPFVGRQAAESARAILSENNIDSIPLIVR